MSSTLTLAAITINIPTFTLATININTFTLTLARYFKKNYKI